MQADALRDAEVARREYVNHVHELPALREQLEDARGTVEWIASFPEPVERFGVVSYAAIGLAEPVRRLLNTPPGKTPLIEYAALIALLAADGDALAGAFGPQVAKALGVGPEATPETEAMWADDIPESYRRAQLERAQGLLPFSQNPHLLAEEASDFRPDPPSE